MEKEIKEDYFITPSQVRARLGGISTTSLWRLVKKGILPKPIYIGSRAPKYKNSWIDALLALEAGTQLKIGEEDEKNEKKQ